MFKRPIEVNLNTQDTTVNHRVAVAPTTLQHISRTVTDSAFSVGFTVMVVLGAKALTDIAVHIAKTKIK